MQKQIILIITKYLTKPKKNVIILLIPNKIKLKYILKEQVKLTVIIIF